MLCFDLVTQLDSISVPARRLKLMHQLDVPCTSGSKQPNQFGRPLTVPARYLRPVQLRRPFTVLAWISSRLLQSKQAAHVKYSVSTIEAYFV
ncbi:protein SUPPRESSOR OF npr1-1, CONSTITUTIVE 1-like [Dorcoceras hygrometricum]|uniref:Protein SUPPRESSOR OF npr1-1, CONSTITUTIVE 1-like n=1 Tax=Dorcoceras hygrometricum TaxID=472368 RepID=A0A2Z7AC43_9LAMI|nr:protein SUPPRESSOR OF npr1-1, CONSTITUTIVE 1-like [Dorcoceras hygrometricum]